MTRPDPTGPDPDAQSAFEELAAVSFAEHSLQSLVQRVTDLAARVVPGESVASVTIASGHRPATVAASGPLAEQLDDVQYRTGAGPCLWAATHGEVAEILDTSTDTRWPQLAAAAVELGCRSILSVPLPIQEQVAGGLNFYARELNASDERARRLAARFAAYAVVPVSNMYLYQSAVERGDHLQAALDSRAVIDQAKGILMERLKITADQAFQLLARVSMETNTKVREVAERLVTTGLLEPGPR